MEQIRYEIPYDRFYEYPRPWIFLAGPTVRGHQLHLQPSWRFAAIEEFKRQNFNGTLIIPEFTDPRESDKGRDDIPLWEDFGLMYSTCIMFWIPRTKELIGLTTNFELGYHLRHREKVVYGRPDDAYRIRYLDIMWERDFDRYQVGSKTIHRTLEETVRAAIKLT